LRDRTNAWAIGDCANILNAHDGQSSPPTGQFAERQGRQCADNIVRVLAGEPTRPFTFKVLGQLCSIGGHSAVAEMLGSSCPASSHGSSGAVSISSSSRHSRAACRSASTGRGCWFFPRDLSCIRTDVTERISHAHFEPGDYIIRQGEPPSGFYVIEQGEVEIVRASPGENRRARSSPRSVRTIFSGKRR
jgi:NADH dehydrogenase